MLTARAKGLSNWQIVRKHGFRNALLPIVTLVALSLGFIIGGSITIEYVFSYPGIGLETVEAIDQRDWPLLPGDLPAPDVLGDPLQPDRRPPLREARPAGRGGLGERPLLPPTAFDEQAAVADIGGIETRGRLAFFRSAVLRRPSMIFGLTILMLFILVAIFAPFLEPYDPEGEDRRRLRAAVERPLAGHGRRRGGHALACHRGLASLPHRRLRRRARRHADRRDDRALVGLLRRQERHDPHADHRLRPRDPGTSP